MTQRWKDILLVVLIAFALIQLSFFVITNLYTFDLTYCVEENYIKPNDYQQIGLTQLRANMYANEFGLSSADLFRNYTQLVSRNEMSTDFLASDNFIILSSNDGTILYCGYHK